MMPALLQSHSDDPLSKDQSALLLGHQRAALRALLLFLSVATPLVTLSVALRDGIGGLMWVGFGLSTMVWCSMLAFFLGHLRIAANTVIAAIFLASIFGMAVYGSVRSAAVLLMLGGVVAAGAFLPRSNLIAATICGAVALGVLNWLESHGRLPTPNPETGLAVWATQVTVLVSMLLSVFYGRHRLMSSFVEQEKALLLAQQSQDRFEALFQASPAASLVQSAKSLHVMDVNEAFCETFACSRESMMGKAPHWHFAHEVDREAYITTLEGGHSVRNMHILGVRNDGEKFACLLNAEVVNEGTEKLILVMVVDISAQLASQQALEKSRERFTKAFEFSPLGMTITRLSDGMFMEVNPANEHVIGWSREDFMGKTALEVGVWVSVEDRNEYADALRRYGRIKAFPTRMRSKSGEVVDIRIWAESIDLDGVPCALSFTLNVAEEKRRETVLLNVAQGVSSVTGKAFFVSLAENISKAIGADCVVIAEATHGTRLEVLGMVESSNNQSCCPADFIQSTYRRLMAEDGFHVLELAGDKAAFGDPSPDSPSPHTVAGLVLRDSDGSPVGMLASVWNQAAEMGIDTQALMEIFASRCNAELIRLRRDREIQRLHETLELRVQARTAQLQYLNQELDAFAYSVSHDLKSPLRSIDGFMHILKEQLEGRQTSEDAHVIQRVEASVARMNSLITDLLSLARVSQGQLQRMHVDLTDLATGVIRQQRHLDPMHEVTITIAPRLSANCDPRLVEIVLENLLGNAWKYSHGMPNPHIEFGQLPNSTPEDPAFYVRDNGAGFDMALAPRLFKPFNRLHSANEFEGSGIGLATVRRIIERHGGYISGTGAVGKGSTFEFSFGNDHSA